MLMTLPLRLLVIPGAYLFPSQRFRLVSLFMKAICHGIWACLRIGGAHVRRVGRVPTDEPVLVVANHQSLLDIVQITLIATPRVPAFVTRARYRRFVPLVSATMRVLGCPIVDPRRDPEGSKAEIRRGVLELPHGLAIFPEGHRSRDGEILPFHSAGTRGILADRPLPVYLVVNDGAWRVGRLGDLLFRVHWIDAYSEVLGPFTAPVDPAERTAFVRGLRDTLVEALARHRSRTHSA
jgi:1-acyl-sn-glycerol-3-phosphate acyltransferase